MVQSHKAEASLLFEGLPTEFQMWMSHGDKIHELPQGFVDIGVTHNSEHAAIANPQKKFFGLQFHPEVGCFGMWANMCSLIHLI